MAQGLQSRGWIKVASAREIGGGKFADIMMSVKAIRRPVPIESKYVAIAKVQQVQDEQVIWNEVNILRGVPA